MPRAPILAVLVVLWLVPAAGAATRDQVQNDCADGELRGTYTAQELRDARNNLRTEVDEYTDCRELLGRALASISRPRERSRPAGASTIPARDTAAPTPAEDRALQAVRSSSRLRIEVGDMKLDLAGPAGVALLGGDRDIPGPVLVMLLLLGAMTLFATTASIRRHVVARRQN